MHPAAVEGVTYAKKIDKAETRIDFSRPAIEVRNHIHGLSPFPGAWFEAAGSRVKVLACETAEGEAAPGTVLDDHLTIACGGGAVRLLKPAARGQGADAGAGIPARYRHRRRNAVGVMPRYKLTIEYDGAPFVGWQMQANGVVGAGCARRRRRHDQRRPGSSCMAPGAPMPAFMRWARWRMSILTKAWDPFVLRNALNANVRPHPVSVLEAEPVADDFHARFSATSRHYLYRILNRRSPPALDRGKVWWLPAELDADAMHDAAQVLSASMTSPPSAPRSARRITRQDARPARCGALRRADRDPRRCALVPAQSGALDGRLAEAGGRRQMAGARYKPALEAKDRAAAARWRRPMGSICSKSTTEIGFDDAAVDRPAAAQFLERDALVGLWMVALVGPNSSTGQ